MQQPATAHDTRPAWLALIAAAALALVAGWFVLGGGIDQLRAALTPAESGDVGTRAPLFTLSSLHGGDVRLSDYRGQVVLVNFWATWCVPCRTEMPELEQAYRAYRDRGFQVLAVDFQESEAEVEPFVSELGLTFPALLDRDGAVGRLYRTRALPSSFLIDQQGVVRFVKIGPLTTDILDEELGKLLK